MVEIPASADINEIEQRVQAAGRQAMREATQKAVRAAEELRKTCPYCGSEAIRSEGTDQRIILTQFGRVVLPLRRLRCQACRRRFRPAEACLKSLQGGKVTAALSAACSEAGASFPYVTAAQVGHSERDGSARQARPTAHDQPSRQSDLRACQYARRAQLCGHLSTSG